MIPPASIQFAQVFRKTPRLDRCEKQPATLNVTLYEITAVHLERIEKVDGGLEVVGLDAIHSHLFCVHYFLIAVRQTSKLALEPADSIWLFCHVNLPSQSSGCG